MGWKCRNKFTLKKSLKGLKGLFSSEGRTRKNIFWSTYRTYKKKNIRDSVKLHYLNTHNKERLHNEGDISLRCCQGKRVTQRWSVG